MTTVLVIALIVLFMVAGAKLSAQRDAEDAARPPNPALVCPHCQVKGEVVAKPVTQKKGISGGKATGAILTGGVSMLATGLSRKEAHTEMTCRNCKTVWYV